VTPTPDEQLKRLCRGAAEVIPADELKTKISSGRPLRVKLGLDPTAKHVTLGWAVVLRKLRAFQDLGHTAVLIVGDFTARIGDPSGKDETRPMLSKEQVDEHAEHLLTQFGKILSSDNLEIRRNSEWLEPLGVEGLLEVSTHYTVARMLERNDFAERYEAQAAISMREFMYPLLQGYDSIAVQADVELGGTDQHFNLLVGRHLQRAYDQEPQVVMTMPLLVGTDGVKKMSQSLGNYIGITEDPDEMFGKVMRIPDELMSSYFRLATALSDEDIERLEAELPPQKLKRALAHQVVCLYHDEAAAKAAADRFDRIFVEGETPTDVPEAPLPAGDGDVHLPKLLKDLGLASSTSEARRLISQGGVHVNGEALSSENASPDALRGRVLRVGKHRFVRLICA
jgi:tyrosyl-tRNA synthetase